MAIERQTLVYDGPGGPFEGVAAWDDRIGGERPAVLVLPNIMGQKEADNLKAEALARLGYVALAADIYGQGKRDHRDAPNFGSLMNALNENRPLLRDRLFASLEALRALPQADANRVAAIGFCFGGKCVLDLARAGADIVGGVSFHGVYDAPGYPVAEPITAKLLICHGWDDPLAPPEAVLALSKELTDAKADWQLHAYGHTAHAFTDENANMPPRAFYEPKADARSWEAMKDFLVECFGT